MFAQPAEIPSTDNMKAFTAALPITLRANRSKMWMPAGLVFGATFFVILSFFRNGGTVLMIWSMAQIVLSVFIVRSMFFRPLASLSIAAEGFTLSTQNEGKIIPWHEIETFSTVSIAGAKAAAYQFTDASGKQKAASRYTIPTQFDIQPILLADTLEKCRKYFTSKRK